MMCDFNADKVTDANTPEVVASIPNGSKCYILMRLLKNTDVIPPPT